MKKLGFEHQGASTYLAYELGAEDNIDSMSLGMLMNNRIPGFAPTVFTQMDNTKQVKCDVTARVPADQYLLGTVNKKRLLGAFRGIVQAFISAEDYMIDTRTIQLELSSIFVDVATGETVLICIPMIREEAEVPDLRSFFKDILFSAQYDERENRDYVAKIMSYLNGTPVFSVREFKALLDYIDIAPAVQQAAPLQHAQNLPEGPQIPSGGPASAPEPEDGKWKAPLADPLPEKEKAEKKEQADPISLFYLLQHYNKENAALYKAQKETKKAEKKDEAEKKKAEKQKKSPQNFAVPGQPELSRSSKPKAEEEQPVVQQPVYQPPVVQPPVSQSSPQITPVTGGLEDTVYYGGYDGDATVLMGQEPQMQRLIPYLLRKRNQEKIPINKTVFRLGRDRDYNEYPIIDNRYIGHSHCHILCRDGEYFLVDDNSKNGTKLNGIPIQPGTENKMRHGMIICIADEEFEFKLY